ncbi:MAG: hypothetical protein Q8P90_01265 [bacterium]|nr:hypothetical protein [bacterium]
MHKLLQDKWFLVGLCGSVIVNIAIWLMLYYYLPETENPVVLHYNIYFGIDLIGEWSKLFYIPASGLVILVVNTVFSILLTKKEKLLSSILEISSLLAQLALLGATVLIIFSNLI